MTDETTVKDLSKLLSLLSEYTSKLRTVCERRSNLKLRRLRQMAMVVLVICGGVVSALVASSLDHTQRQKEDIDPLNSRYAAAGIVIAFGAATYLMLSLQSLRPLYDDFDAKQIASTVERLIKTASQYSEHATNRISDKFEFDLRLAEAEAALHFYSRLFERTTLLHEVFSLFVR